MNTRELGAVAESFTAKWLEKRGYEILERNFFIRGGEIDIIAKKGETLIFVEVRSWEKKFWEGGTPLETISKTKIKHIIKTACSYLQAKKIKAQTLNIRFDVAALVKNGSSFDVDYIEAAFDATGF